MVWCCDFVVLLVVDVWVDYGGVYVFYVCFDLCVFMILALVLMYVV